MQSWDYPLEPIQEDLDAEREGFLNWGCGQEEARAGCASSRLHDGLHGGRAAHREVARATAQSRTRASNRGLSAVHASTMSFSDRRVSSPGVSPQPNSNRYWN